MYFNKSKLSAALALAMGGTAMGASGLANAALATNATLNINAGVYSCIAGQGTPPNDCTYGTNVRTGSFFSMDADGSGTVQPTEKVAITQHDGIFLGTIQGATGSHSTAPFGVSNSYTGTAPIQVGQTANGAPIWQTDGSGNQVLQDVTEVPGIDEPWNFFSNTGMHFTNAAITVSTDDGAGNVTLDFSGWRVTWNGIPSINMGLGAAAVMNCGGDCTVGDTYILDYSAEVPLGDPSGFGGVPYAVHLEGTIAAPIPVPAAVWLFGSGLLGLVGVARRKKTA